MDKKRKLKILNKIKTDVMVDKITNNQVDNKIVPKNSHPNQTNPIYKNLNKFNNTKIGSKLSIKDLLR